MIVSVIDHSFRPSFSSSSPFGNPPKLKRRFLTRSSTAETGSSTSTPSMASEERENRAIKPVYEPKPPNRPLRTPHSGYHFDGSTRQFFEGWYFKVSIPEKRQSFSFIYTVENNPAFREKLTPSEEARYGKRFTGVGAQVLGAYDKYICQYSKESHNFWGSWIEWNGERFEFENAASYLEKNWGGAFPRKWFWVQCNVFQGASGEVALTVAGGAREILGGRTEDAALLRAPTLEAGLAPACKDTCFGDLKLQLWERRSDGSKGKMILDVTSDMAAVEVGGGPWFNTWTGKARMSAILSGALRVPVNMEAAFSLVPFWKPPGL